jgi:hypothetical protein
MRDWCKCIDVLTLRQRNSGRSQLFICKSKKMETSFLIEVVLNNTSDVFFWSLYCMALFSGHAKHVHLSRGELGHGLGALRDGVLGELTRENEAHGGLDFSRGQGGFLVHAGQLHESITEEINVSQWISKHPATFQLSPSCSESPSSAAATYTACISHLRSLRGNFLEHISNERVEDGHRLGGNASVGVHLLEHLEDVELVGLYALLGLLLVALGLGGSSLLHGFLAGGGSHGD